MTERYNAALRENLPGRGVELREIPRLESGKAPLSASAVRALLEQGDWDALKQQLPETTYRYLAEKTHAAI